MTKYAARGISVEFEGAPLGQLTAFGEVGSTRDLIDASAYGDDWKDYVLGQQDGTEVAGVVAYDVSDTGHALLVSQYDTLPDAIVTFTLIHAISGLTLDVSCRLTSLSRGGDLGGLLQMSFGAKIVEPGVVEGS